MKRCATEIQIPKKWCNHMKGYSESEKFLYIEEKDL